MQVEVWVRTGKDGSWGRGGMSARTKESFCNSLLDAQDPGVACQVGSIRAWDILQSAIREKGSGPNEASSKIWGNWGRLNKRDAKSMLGR